MTTSFAFPTSSFCVSSSPPLIPVLILTARNDALRSARKVSECMHVSMWRACLNAHTAARISLSLSLSFLLPVQQPHDTNEDNSHASLMACYTCCYGPIAPMLLVSPTHTAHDCPPTHRSTPHHKACVNRFVVFKQQKKHSNVSTRAKMKA